MLDLDYIIYLALYMVLTGAAVMIASAEKHVMIWGYNKKQSDIIWILFFSFLLAVVACLRPMTTPDTESYYNVYGQGRALNTILSGILRPGSRISGIERGFWLLFYFFKLLHMHFRVVLFVMAFLNASLILIGAWKIATFYYGEKADVFHLIALFFCLFGMHYCCIAIRAGLSIGLSVCSIALLIRKKWIGSFLVLLIASLMHIMTLLSLAAYFLFALARKAKKPSSSKFIIAVSCLCVFSLLVNFGSFFIEQVVDLILAMFSRWNIGGFSGYINKQLDKKVGIKDLVIVITTAGVLFMLLRQKDRYKKIPYVILIGMLITSFLYPIRAINRAADYFFIYLLPLIAVYEKKKIPMLYRVGLTIGANALYFAFMLNL